MRFEQERIPSADGTILRAGYWQPEGSPKGMLTLCHGQSEHIGRYNYLGQRLTDAGYGLYMAELRGHGESQGQRGHVDDFRQYKADFQTMLDQSRQRQPDVPHVLGGHSMGGLIASHYAMGLTGGYSAVVLSSAWIDTAADINPLTFMLAQVMQVVWPSFSQDTGLDPKLLSHDEAVVEAYEKDPLVHGKMSAGAFSTLVKAQEEVRKNAHQITLPLYMIHGSEDGIADPQATQHVYEKAASKEKIYKLYQGLYHELFNELERDTVIDGLIIWLDENVE